LKSGIFAGIGFGIATAGIDYYDGDDFELKKFIFKILFFLIFMGFILIEVLKNNSKRNLKPN
jgi:hypothetical protein